MIRSLAAMLLLALAGCAHRTANGIAKGAPALRSQDDTFLDLKPGYRLRVITPLTRSGSFRVATAPAAATKPGETITLRASDDFIGYETAYYSVDGAGNRLRVPLVSVEQMVDGKPGPAAKPLVRLFELPRGTRYARLIYLIRQSAADHDMAFLGADSLEHLDQLTLAVRADGTTCVRARGLQCSWIPNGLAVRAEVQGTNGEWQPAR
jgi:hypothetical protein